MATPEKRMKDKVVKALKSFGDDVWYFFPGNNGFGKSGVPDIVVCAYGFFIGVEVKSDETKKATALQQLQGERIQTAFGDWFLVRSEREIETLRVAINRAMDRKRLIKRGF